MDRVSLLNLFVSSRQRVEQGNLDIEAQSMTITGLNNAGLNSNIAIATLVKIMSQPDADLMQMERLLDELDEQVSQGVFTADLVKREVPMKDSLDPDEMTILAKVIDEACLKLGRTDETTKEVLAMRVISYALRGERDLNNLLSMVLNGKKIANAE